MGYIRHHAIIVTSWDGKALEKAHCEAGLIFGENVSNIVHADLNGYDSFFIGPDGSKESWEDSNIGDKNRETFIKWIKTQEYEDGSNRLAFAEFYYGDDNKKSQITKHN